MANPFTSAQAPQSTSPAMQLIAPELVAEQLKNARLQQIAQMMREQGMQHNGDTQVINGWAVKRSPMEGISKIAQILAGSYMQKQSDEKNAEIQRTFADKLAKAVAAGNQPSSTNDAVYEMRGGLDDPVPQGEMPVFGSVAAPANMQQTGGAVDPFNMANVVRGVGLSALDPNVGKAFWDSRAPTTMQRENEYLGIPAEVARANALAEARVKGTQTLANGQTAILPDGQRITGIDQDKGINTIWNGTTPISTRIQGTSDILAENAAAIQEGTNRATLAPTEALPRNPDGTYQPATIDQVINPNPLAAQVSPFDPKGTYGTPAQLLDNLIKAESSGNPYALNPKTKALGAYQFMPETVVDLAKKGIKFNPFDANESRAAADYYISQLAKQHGGDYRKAMAAYGGFVTQDPTQYVNKVMNGVTANQPAGMPAPRGAGEPFGLKKAIEGNVELANTRYNALASKNANAPVMLDALDNVIKYAPGAITGGLSEKRELVNSIEALIPGFSGAKTAQEKTDLLKKNMNRIVGSGSNVPGATDALRNIVEASNPNSKMGLKAIQEASRQLKSIIRMEQANQRVVENMKFANDFGGVIKTDAEFNRIADPKIWEMEEMNPQERQAFVSGLSPKAAKELLEKRAKIKAMGGL